jgi:hypothetical protein
MKRRGFLRLLGLSPIAAPIAAQEAVSSLSVASTPVGSHPSEGTPTPSDPLMDVLSQRVSEFRVKNETYVGPNPRFESMKSWSPVFKHGEARKEFVKNQRLRNKLDEILYSNLSIAEKAVRLAALGVKV